MSQDYFILRHLPNNFNPSVIAAGCCCVFEDKLLLLKRHPEKPYGNTWGVPGGKMEQNEDIRACVVREIQEEAGIDIDDEGLKAIGTLYCSIPQEFKPLQYVFHLFQKRFTTMPTLNLGLEEHLEAKWASREEALSLPLIIGGKEVLDFFIELNPV